MRRIPQIAAPTRKSYPSDLRDTEWEVFKALLREPIGFGHPIKVDLR